MIIVLYSTLITLYYIFPWADPKTLLLLPTFYGLKINFSTHLANKIIHCAVLQGPPLAVRELSIENYTDLPPAGPRTCLALYRAQQDALNWGSSLPPLAILSFLFAFLFLCLSLDSNIHKSLLAPKQNIRKPYPFLFIKKLPGDSYTHVTSLPLLSTLLMSPVLSRLSFLISSRPFDWDQVKISFLTEPTTPTHLTSLSVPLHFKGLSLPEGVFLSCLFLGGSGSRLYLILPSQISSCLLSLSRVTVHLTFSTASNVQLLFHLNNIICLLITLTSTLNSHPVCLAITSLW